jgi:hypothetical protein
LETKTLQEKHAEQPPSEAFDMITMSLALYWYLDIPFCLQGDSCSAGSPERIPRVSEHILEYQS